VGSEYEWVEIRPGRKLLVRKKWKGRKRLGNAPVVRTDYSFDDATRESLSKQTGRDIRTRSDLNRYLAENGSRIVEPGDHVDRTARDIDDVGRYHGPKWEGYRSKYI